MTRTSAQTVALSAGEVVLGLLIEQPANSYQLERRLEGRFGSAQFAHGTAYQAVKRLSKRGLVRVVDRDPQAALDVGGERSTTYEATREGCEYFESWLRASSTMPPVREELLAKVAFCGPADLPRMIEIVRQAEGACITQLENLNARVRRERRLARADDDDDDGWRSMMGTIVSAGDYAWWDARIRWLQQLREYLQREGERYEIRRRSAATFEEI
jgi:DNA-binding PadR family transcriptional regulator